ncbi:MAG TPA: hypothetical protein VFR02_09765, partial [bacterium]|nr:hypothetical protein [bacterium]
PFGTAGDSGEVSFAITAPQGNGELLAFEITDATTKEPLAVGAVKADVQPGMVSDLFVTMGTVISPCYTVDTSSMGGNAYVNFDQDQVAASDTVTADLSVSSYPSGSVTYYQFTPQNGAMMAYLGNGDLVDFAAVPDPSAFNTGSSSFLNKGDVYCLQLAGGLYAWVQVADPNEPFGLNPPGPQGPLLRFRVSDQPYYAYYRTASDANSNCTVPPPTPTPIGPTGSTAVNTYAGSGQKGASNGLSLSASFNYPSGVAIDSAGDLFVADTFNNRIRKIDTSGNVSTLAGTGAEGSADGPAGQATFSRPFGIAVNAAGTTVIVADTANSEIRVIDVNNAVVTTLAGAVSQNGYVDSTNFTLSRVDHPVGVAVDPSGTTIFVADTGNHVIRAITSAGVTTYAGSNYSCGAGTCGSEGDVDGAQLGTAEFDGPVGVAVDGSGNVYVSEGKGRLIRKVSGGTVSTLAGCPDEAGYSNGTAGECQGSLFNIPVQLSVDAGGNIYIADPPNNVIRVISSGFVNTLAGSGTSGYANGPTNVAQFKYPEGVVVNSAGTTVFVVDTNNQRIRSITLP